MKTIKFAKRWCRPTSKTTYEEYPVGSEANVSNEVAEAAKKAGVLDGEPVDVAEPAADVAARPKTTKA